MSADPYGRAIRDWYHDRLAGPLEACDGPETEAHPIERYYFEPPAGEALTWLQSWLSGPLLDVGAGAGRHALVFQDAYETVAIEVSEALVETMTDRGVRDAREVDMFDLPGTFGENRFQSLLVVGTQLGLARSSEGITGLLSDMAQVTTADGTAVVDSYDPTVAGTESLLGYRDDPAPGLAFRVLRFEYDGATGRPLLFRLFSPNRLRELVDQTPWHVADITEVQGESPRL